ncbi:cytidine deaminase [Parasalinivibrio latis]|uniref:cytidine deaminase n=1 Tax=Parasalinivibrio latis TaxID=2952610 RepID=UPI0030E133CD
MRARFEAALNSMPEQLAELLMPVISNNDFDASLTPEQFQELMDKSGLDDKALRLALLPVAAAYSHAPISNFYVGAIARGLSGRLYFGANMEFSGTQLGQTIHAEQCAISHAWVKGESELKDITINYSPCGHCRQFMNELAGAENLRIQLPDVAEKSLHDYLPEAFGPANLGIKDGLLTPVNHGLNVESEEALVHEALYALNRSHAPYSKNISGVALRSKSGQVYHGMYAENAAFNPSLPPLQVALIAMNMAGEKLTDVEEAALIEIADSPVSHLQETQGTLETLNPDLVLHYLAI